MGSTNGFPDSGSLITWLLIANTSRTVAVVSTSLT
jgi:hypothetical protein